MNALSHSSVETLRLTFKKWDLLLPSSSGEVSCEGGCCQCGSWHHNLLNIPSYLSGADSPALTLHCIYKNNSLSSPHRDMEACVKLSAMKYSNPNEGKWESGSMLIVNFLVECLSCKILLYF